MKELIIIRHGIAEDRDDFARTGLPDSERPLTAKGKIKIKKISNWLKTQIKGELDLIVDSPLLRSKQTLDILKLDLKFNKSLNMAELNPDVSSNVVLNKILSLKKNRVLVVGHEPQLSSLIQLLLGQADQKMSFFKLKKGSIVFFKFKPHPILYFYVSPKNII